MKLYVLIEIGNSMWVIRMRGQSQTPSIANKLIEKLRREVSKAIITLLGKQNVYFI